MKKSTLIPLILVVYLAVMAGIGFPRFQSGEYSPQFYFGTIAVTLFVIWLLRCNLLKRGK
ncbi:MAG: hypothetical protein K2I94_08035 [Muribaculaceae bacterium]|nr:hypothetical protein [Muribaculaceae bacterium]